MPNVRWGQELLDTSALLADASALFIESILGTQKRWTEAEKPELRLLLGDKPAVQRAEPASTGRPARSQCGCRAAVRAGWAGNRGCQVEKDFLTGFAEEYSAVFYVRSVSTALVE